MNILVYGAGAVGLGLASCLLKSGKKVDLVARPDTRDALLRDGLRRFGIFGEFKAPPADFHCVSRLEDLDDTSYDFILVCVKSFDTQHAGEDLSSHPRLKQCRMVLCQNGWGNAEKFSSFIPKEQIYNARVITGFKRPRKNEVEITVHADAVHIGSLFENDMRCLQPLCDAIDEGGIPCELTESIGKDLWAKMLYNCPLNALGTLFNVPYGLLGESEYTRELMKNIVEEVYTVMQAEGHTTHWENAEKYLETFYAKLLPPTYKHESSMLQDIRAQKKTEIDAMNGAVVELGKQHGIEVPFNLTVYNMVKFLETKHK